MTTGTGDIAAWLRGRLHMAGIDGRASLGAALDVLQCLIIDLPKDHLAEWRDRFDQAMRSVGQVDGPTPPVRPARPVYDRETWGLTPEQQAQTRRLMTSLG